MNKNRLIFRFLSLARQMNCNVIKKKIMKEIEGKFFAKFMKEIQGNFFAQFMKKIEEKF